MAVQSFLSFLHLSPILLARVFALDCHCGFCSLFLYIVQREKHVIVDLTLRCSSVIPDSISIANLTTTNATIL